MKEREIIRISVNKLSVCIYQNLKTDLHLQSIRIINK